MRGLVVFIWEQWRQSYKALAIVFAALLLYALVAWRFTDLLLYIFSLNRALVIACAYLPALGAVALLFLQENRGRVGFSYPRRMLVMPAHTAVLVAAPLLFRLAMIALFGYATGWVCNAFLTDSIFFKGPEILLLMTLVAAMHAYVFLACGYGAGTGTAIFMVAFVINLPALNAFLGYIVENIRIPTPLPSEFILPDIGYGGVPVALVVIPYWFVVAYMGARYARSEVAEDQVGGFVRVVTRLAYFDRERTEFGSPDAAQQWIEWRRGAYLFPWLSFALGVILVVTLQGAAEQMENRFSISFYVLAVSPAVVASLVGYTVTRSGSDYQWFVGPRPLTTAAIANARLWAGVKAIVSGYALLAILFVVSFKVMFPGEAVISSLVHDLRVITSTDGTYSEGVKLLMLMSLFAVLSSWTLFWLARTSGVLVWLAGAGVGLMSYAQGGIYQLDEATGAFTTPLSTFIPVFAALAGVAGMCAIVSAVWRGYIRPTTLVVSAIAWAVLVYLGLGLGAVVSLGGPMVVGAWLLMPFVPLASIPLTIEWQRHR